MYGFIVLILPKHQILITITHFNLCSPILYMFNMRVGCEGWENLYFVDSTSRKILQAAYSFHFLAYRPIIKSYSISDKWLKHEFSSTYAQDTLWCIVAPTKWLVQKFMFIIW